MKCEKISNYQDISLCDIVDGFYVGLPNEDGRLQILEIHTTQLRKSKMLGEDVHLEELAKCTKNYSGAEIEGLVRSATSTAMNKLIKVRVWPPVPT